MTILTDARKGIASQLVHRIARDERTEPDRLLAGLVNGSVVIPANRQRTIRRPVGIGAGLRTKVNANIGTSEDYPNLDAELVKLRTAVDAGTDTVMDLSTGGDLEVIRRRILEESPVPVGSVSIYDAAVESVRSAGSILEMTAASMLEAFRRHAVDGVDFVTIHAGVTRAVVEDLVPGSRVCGIVSRGGTFLAQWMKHHRQENPYYERFDEVIDVAREYDVTLSLGDGLRPGAIADAGDRPQIHELETLAELADRARTAGVQVIIEGPGHVPMHRIVEQVALQKKLCKGAPFYVLGPIVTDIAPGYDHITGAIGGAIAAAAGADFLCYVTPAEHLSLPGPEHVHHGVMASRIAAHAADVAKGIAGAAERDKSFSELRRRRDWEGQIAGALDPELARRLRTGGRPADNHVCSMCGEFCVFKVADDLAGKNE